MSEKKSWVREIRDGALKSGLGRLFAAAVLALLGVGGGLVVWLGVTVTAVWVFCVLAALNVGLGVYIVLRSDKDLRQAVAARDAALNAPPPVMPNHVCLEHARLRFESTTKRLYLDATLNFINGGRDPVTPRTALGGNGTPSLVINGPGRVDLEEIRVEGACIQPRTKGSVVLSGRVPVERRLDIDKALRGLEPKGGEPLARVYLAGGIALALGSNATSEAAHTESIGHVSDLIDLREGDNSGALELWIKER